MTRMDDARVQLRDLTAVGAGLYLIGIILTVVTWPSDSGGRYGGSSGSALWATLFAVLTSVGACLLLVGLVGYGVKIGRQASPSAPPAHTDA